jgi:hypothetical protein
MTLSHFAYRALDEADQERRAHQDQQLKDSRRQSLKSVKRRMVAVD